ncbi:MAG: RloB family protein [Synergistaceae bacterium]|jgi:hypothetical protein|nr:RloB family protein [Synergistaceae bacterium]
MARDNQPKDRQRKKLERKSGRRATYDRLLIVCEGEKTEPHYFDGVRKDHRLSPVCVKTMPGKYGTLPQQVIDYAYDYCSKENNKWEKIFCVFDRDDHPNFENAIRSAMSKNRTLLNDQGQKIDFLAIPSVPCFELWLFLHFEGVTSQISRFNLLKRLKKYIPGYEKSATDHFEKTKDRLETAYRNTAQLSRNRNGPIIQNPFTAVDEVMKALMNLVKQSGR